MRILSGAMLASTTLAQTTTQLFNFTTAIRIENSALRPNGHILFTTLDQNRLYALDPLSPHPQAEIVATFPGITATNGIAAIGDDKFAMIGGIRGDNYQYTNENLFTIDFTNNATVATVTALPEAVMLNGLASLPANPHIVLLADSGLGSLFRVDTETGETTMVFQDEVLSPPANATTPIGINGLKVAGDYAYFTITARGLFARVRISEVGDIVGDVEIISHAVDGNSWDDFVFDDAGVAYVCQGDNSIVGISSDGEQEVVAGGDGSMDIFGPTSVSLPVDAGVMYVTTRGGTVDGVVYGGQVVKVVICFAYRY